MKYRCQICGEVERGGNTRAEFVEHMRIFHGARISEADLIALEADAPNARSAAQQRRRAREREQASVAYDKRTGRLLGPIGEKDR